MAAAKIPKFTEEEMAIDQNLGYPKAYSKLCNINSNSSTSPFLNGPPLSFIPYTLQPQEALRAKDLNQMFPVIDPDAKPAPNPRGFVNLLWKQLDHLGNAGFDPELFRVDPFGNVLYLHADSASPLAWDVDHWFPCSRGGRTVPSNLRILQWQVCRKKKNKLDFLVPWWDLQLGISVNQFLSVFASKNLDFRNRAFSFLFLDGSCEELNALQAVDSHSFPQHFVEMKQKLGLAPAALVSTNRNSESSVLKPVNMNKSLRPNSPYLVQRMTPNTSKENEPPESDEFANNPYLTITRARDSLRQRGDSKKKEAEMSQLEDELNEFRQKNEEERIALQDLEALLIKRRRRVEKCRRLSEAQASYRALLEKMIRDAMHQSVVYKEQLRLNQAATSALMARLEAQRAMCDTSENKLRRKFNERDELEKQISRPCWELQQARKRSRMDYNTLFEERNEDCIKGWTPLKKELRVFLEEEQKASEAGHSLSEEEKEEEEEHEDIENLTRKNKGKKSKALLLAERTRQKACEGDDKLLNHKGKKSKALILEERTRQKECEDDDKLLNHKLGQLAIRETNEIFEEGKESNKKFLDEEDEEERNQLGKGNVEKWLQIMLENAKGGEEENQTAETINRLNRINPEKESKSLKLKPLDNNRRSFNEKREESCESSSRGFRSTPSSPSVIMGMRRSEANLDSMASTSSKFIKSCTRTIKRTVNK
ncbi:myosin-3 [Asparagus officinalis]|uniref:myosin-3 n=1 Tax=Asparagus officinalis TaxID=4686 RepID=UPI00098E3B0F|nr:myosin-3 [Asparagus officinalis]